MNSDQAQSNFDVIIIGAGLGGLTAGALLSKRGKKVLILEQHKIPGGCATTFDRKNYKVEVGLNALGGFDDDDIKQKIVKELNINSHVKFLRLPEFYYFKSEEGDFIMPNNLADIKHCLVSRFPEEEKGIEKYFRKILAIRKQMNRYCSWSYRKQLILFALMPVVCPAIVFNMFRTIQQFLDKTFKNQLLKKILLANLAYYHNDCSSLSLLYFAAGQGEYYSGGAYFIQGGSQTLSNYLADVIVKNNGTLQFHSLATDILASRRGVTGVKYIQKVNQKETIRTVYSKIIIANAAIPKVVEMLPCGLVKKIVKQTKDLSLSPSFFMVFLTFKQALKKIGTKYYSSFFDSNPQSNSRCSTEGLEFYSSSSFYFCDYSHIDAQMGCDELGQGVICCNDTLKNWDTLSEAKYYHKKEAVANLLINRMEESIPGLRNEIVRYEVGTPKTIERFIQTPGGAVYGFAQTPSQAVPFRLSVKSRIKGLYFASAWSFPGGGFSGTMIGGYSCANAILPSGN